MSTDDMQGQPMENSARSQEIFHGFLLFEESEEEPMVKDGAGQSRIKVVEGGTITAIKKNIVLKSIPNGDSPGRMEVQCSTPCTATGNNTIEFCCSDKILTETKKKVTIATPHGPGSSDSMFHLKSKSATNGECMMVNCNHSCVCLVVKEDGNELVPLTEDEIEREKSRHMIQHYITVYQGQREKSSSSPNNIALFFTYKKADQKTYNCYLVPNHRCDKLELDEKEVEGKNDNELRVLHESYLKFYTKTVSQDLLMKCASDQVPDKKFAAGNNGASPTGSFSASLDSGHSSGEKE